MTARLMPHSLDAEQSVLGGLMLDPPALQRIAWLKADDFYRRDHQLIYCAITELGGKADCVTLGEWFEAQGIAELVGGAKYVMELAANTASAANVCAYAGVVREKYRLREAIAIAERLTEAAFATGAGAQSCIEDALRDLTALAGDPRPDAVVTAPMLARARFEVTIALMAAREMHRGQTPTQAEIDRLKMAIERLADMQLRCEAAKG